jgi:hypothetical protein
LSDVAGPPALVEIGVLNPVSACLKSLNPVQFCRPSKKAQKPVAAQLDLMVQLYEDQAHKVLRSCLASSAHSRQNWARTGPESACSFNGPQDDEFLWWAKLSSN